MAEPRSVRYEVGVTFCNGRSFKSDHDKLHVAMKEYADMLAVGVEPALLTVPGSKHVRMVTFVAFDADDVVVHHINSPIFECADSITAA
jgi:hypothetical protein